RRVPMTDSVFKVNLGPTGLSRPSHPLAAIAAAFVRWRDRNASVRELNRLNDQALSDIGVSRHEIGALIDAQFARRELEAARRSIRLSWPVPSVPVASARPKKTTIPPPTRSVSAAVLTRSGPAKAGFRTQAPARSAAPMARLQRRVRGRLRAS